MHPRRKTKRMDVSQETPLIDLKARWLDWLSDYKVAREKGNRKELLELYEELQDMLQTEIEKVDPERLDEFREDTELTEEQEKDPAKYFDKSLLPWVDEVTLHDVGDMVEKDFIDTWLDWNKNPNNVIQVIGSGGQLVDQSPPDIEESKIKQIASEIYGWWRYFNHVQSSKVDLMRAYAEFLDDMRIKMEGDPTLAEPFLKEWMISDSMSTGEIMDKAYDALDAAGQVAITLKFPKEDGFYLPQPSEITEKAESERMTVEDLTLEDMKFVCDFLGIKYGKNPSKDKLLKLCVKEDEDPVDIYNRALSRVEGEDEEGRVKRLLATFGVKTSVNDLSDDVLKKMCQDLKVKYGRNPTRENLLDVCFKEGLDPLELYNTKYALKNPYSDLPAVPDRKAFDTDEEYDNAVDANNETWMKAIDAWRAAASENDFLLPVVLLEREETMAEQERIEELAEQYELKLPTEPSFSAADMREWEEAAVKYEFDLPQFEKKLLKEIGGEQYVPVPEGHLWPFLQRFVHRAVEVADESDAAKDPREKMKMKVVLFHIDRVLAAIDPHLPDEAAQRRETLKEELLVETQNERKKALKEMLELEESRAKKNALQKMWELAETQATQVVEGEEAEETSEDED